MKKNLGKIIIALAVFAITIWACNNLGLAR